MKRIILIAGLMISVISSTSFANILKDFTGNWRVTTTTQYDGKRETNNSTEKISKLKNGTLHHVSFYKRKGKLIKDGETWYYPNGEIYQVSFDEKGFFESEAEGFWRVTGSRFHIDAALSILEGDVNVTGSLRRVNRNKWTGFFTAAGALRVSVTMTRVGR